MGGERETGEGKLWRDGGNEDLWVRYPALIDYN